MKRRHSLALGIRRTQEETIHSKPKTEQCSVMSLGRQELLVCLQELSMKQYVPTVGKSPRSSSSFYTW